MDDQEDTQTAAQAIHAEDVETRRAAAATLGRVRSEKKAAAARENGKKSPGKQIRPLLTIACTCGRGDGLEHPTTCPRGRIIRYRRKKGLPLT